MTDAESLAEAALAWLLEQAHDTNDGLVWAGDAADAAANPSLYSGTAGVVLTLLEAYHHFGDERYAVAARSGAGALATSVEQVGGEAAVGCSLYLGLTGVAVALAAVGDRLDDRASAATARRALTEVRTRFDGVRWGEQFELLGGNAGIALGALAVGDVELAALAVRPYLTTAEPTRHGVNWEVRRGTPARFHHISHGTLGIVAALAGVGDATGDHNLLDLALAGAADVVSRDVGGPDGLLVPHSDPQHRPDVIERFSFGWCHGPAGDAQVFRLLATVTRDVSWDRLIARCWHTITHSGLPRPLRPGFWDNSGRCCGTAGVLALASDLTGGAPGAADFADVLVDDLAARATVDASGARWCNREHRCGDPVLPAQPGWAMGNAGIVRELLRHARIRGGRDPAYAIPWPDQPGSAGRFVAVHPLSVDPQ